MNKGEKKGRGVEVPALKCLSTLSLARYLGDEDFVLLHVLHR